MLANSKEIAEFYVESCETAEPEATIRMKKVWREMDRDTQMIVMDGISTGMSLFMGYIGWSRKTGLGADETVNALGYVFDAFIRSLDSSGK